MKAGTSVNQSSYSNRLSIFVVHDSEGVVDDYVFFMLQEIKLYVKCLLVVCDGNIQSKYIARLNEVADETYIRDSSDYYCNAYKDVLENLFGWEQTYNYDELLLINDSCFGPLYPLNNIFDKMSGTVDFWGLSAIEPAPTEVFERDCGVVPYHIQSYFLVIEKNMLHGKDFRSFFTNMDAHDTYNNTVFDFDISFTEFFISCGYTCATYIDTGNFTPPAELNCPYLIIDSYRLLSEQLLPFVKIKVFTTSLINAYNYNCGENARKSLEFITNRTVYDVSLIWRHLIRVCNPVDLKNTLHLDYVISSKISYASLPKDKKVAVFAHLYYIDLIDYMFIYIANIQTEIDVIISIKDEALKPLIERKFNDLKRSNYKVILSINRGREVSSFLVECRKLVKQYDYICFIKDKKSNKPFYQTIGQSFMELTLDNSVKNTNFICNVIDLFERNTHLGYLTPAFPYSSTYLLSGILTWEGGNYDGTIRLIERLNIKCKVSPDKNVSLSGGVFWCRTQAIDSILNYDWKYEDFDEEPMANDGTISHAVERIYPYVVQHEGYYSGTLFDEETASLFITNYRLFLGHYLTNKNAILPFVANLMSDENAVTLFFHKFNAVYIYGTGTFGRNCYYGIKDKVTNFSGFIVSDGYRNELMIDANIVYELHEIIPKNDTGIVVAVNNNFQKDILPLLAERGFTNVLAL